MANLRAAEGLNLNAILALHAHSSLLRSYNLTTSGTKDLLDNFYALDFGG
jgi:hypothetical protein